MNRRAITPPFPDPVAPHRHFVYAFENGVLVETLVYFVGGDEIPSRARAVRRRRTLG